MIDSCGACGRPFPAGAAACPQCGTSRPSAVAAVESGGIPPARPDAGQAHNPQYDRPAVRGAASEPTVRLPPARRTPTPTGEPRASATRSAKTRGIAIGLAIAAIIVIGGLTAALVIVASLRGGGDRGAQFAGLGGHASTAMGGPVTGAGSGQEAPSPTTSVPTSASTPVATSVLTGAPTTTVPATAAAQSQSYRVWQTTSIYSGPHLSDRSVGQAPADDWVEVTCKTLSDPVSGTVPDDRVWLGITTDDGTSGFVPDQWVVTNHDPMVWYGQANVPLC